MVAVEAAGLLAPSDPNVKKQKFHATTPPLASRLLSSLVIPSLFFFFLFNSFPSFFFSYSFKTNVSRAVGVHVVQTSTTQAQHLSTTMQKHHFIIIIFFFIYSSNKSSID